jgi:predicted transcriptional regulator
MNIILSSEVMEMLEKMAIEMDDRKVNIIEQAIINYYNNR